MSKVPKETIYDEEDVPVEYGEKFYSPASDLLIYVQSEGRWVKGDELPQRIETAPPVDVISDLGPDFTPVSDNDQTGLPLGRVSQRNSTTS